MFFTQEDYRKIEDYILASGRKDTDFVGASTPLNGEETVVLVQEGKNVKTPIKDIVKQLFLLGVSDFINITDKYDERYISLYQAIKLIPYKSRKIGQVITFLDEDGKWKIYQFRGERVNQWSNTSLWFDIIGEIKGISIKDSEDIVTNKVYGDQIDLKFADKNYNKSDYSGLGRVYLRKNIADAVDPNTGFTYNINILTQSMLSKENTIYIIQYDYDLNGQTIIVPENCILEFKDGGNFSNGTLNCINTTIRIDNFDSLGVPLTGTYIVVSALNEDKSPYMNDTEYNPANYSGLGHVYLRKNNGILTQSNFNKANTIYHIRYDYDLKEKTITIPEGCVLQFEGGNIKNGGIIFNDTIIKNGENNSINNCIISGSLKKDVILNYLGVSPLNTGNTNVANYNNIKLTNTTYIFNKGTYLFSQPIVPKRDTFKGSGSDTILKFDESDGLHFPTHAPEYINRYIGDFTIIAKGNCIDLMVSDSSGPDGVNYSIFNNMHLISLEKNCFYSTIRNAYTYANKFSNLILEAKNGCAFEHCALILTTTLDKVDTQWSMKAFFKNCAFKNTTVSNCNIGWGGNYGYLIFNDIGLETMNNLHFTVNFYNCNFEESITNAIVNLYDSSNVDFIALTVHYKDSSIIYNDSILNKSIYAFSGGNIIKSTLQDKQGYFTPIIGFNLIFIADNCIISNPSFVTNRVTRVCMAIFQKDMFMSWGFPGFSDDMPHDGTIFLRDNILGHVYWKNKHNTQYLPKLDASRRGFYINMGPQGWIWNGAQWIQLNIQKGTGAGKPKLTDSDQGYFYYDTQLERVVCWNGASWVNEDGTLIDKVTII